MKTLNLFALVLFSGLLAMAMGLSACGGTEEKSEEELRDMLLDMEDMVQEIHDDVMPITNDLRRKSQELMAFLETHAEDLDEEAQQEVRSLIERLESAHQSMFDWMGEWADADKESMEFEEAKEFFNKEKERISQVADDMRSSLADAEEYLESLADDHGHDHE